MVISERRRIRSLCRAAGMIPLLSSISVLSVKTPFGWHSTIYLLWWQLLFLVTQGLCRFVLCWSHSSGWLWPTLSLSSLQARGSAAEIVSLQASLSAQSKPPWSQSLTVSPHCPRNCHSLRVTIVTTMVLPQPMVLPQLSMLVIICLWTTRVLLLLMIVGTTLSFLAYPSHKQVLNKWSVSLQTLLLSLKLLVI